MTASSRPLPLVSFFSNTAICVGQSSIVGICKGFWEARTEYKALTLFIICTASRTQGNSFPDFLLAAASHIDSRTSRDADLQGEEGNAAAYACNENIVACFDLCVQYSCPECTVSSSYSRG